MSGLSKAGKYLDQLTGSASTRYIINRYIKDYGHLTDFRIDIGNKTISASILLNGETCPIDLNISEYNILKDKGSTSLLIKNVTSSRPWLTAILKNHVVGIPWKIPPDKTSFLKDFLG